MPRLWINVTSTDSASCNKVIETVASLVKQYNKGVPKIELIRVRHEEPDWEMEWCDLRTAYKKMQGLLDFASLDLAPEPPNEQWQVCIDQAPEDQVDVDLLRCLYNKTINQSEYDLLKYFNHSNRCSKATVPNTSNVNVYASPKQETLQNMLLLDRYLEHNRWVKPRIDIDLNNRDQAVGQILEILHQWLQDPKLPNGVKTIDPNGSLTMHPDKNLAIKWTKVGESSHTCDSIH